ncbi:MAG: cbb3-type cytochrome c oxidase subunit I [Gammaproteobacteria bacterium]|nr:cbb3-type cytochrome c oxidase subunit I [Gammaproteobacteria bacterium]MCP5425267.1 cbb3-type cytochrome c oxidase subunit I [Gammaproteobacteria bacterium]
MTSPASPTQEHLSPWWRRSVIAVMAIGFSVLISLTIKIHHEAPPIPDRVEDSQGTLLFAHDDILAGQQVFLKYGLMDNGSIWGHGGYLGPDFSAQYLHNLAVHVAEAFALQRFGLPFSALAETDRAAIEAEVRVDLKQNRFDPNTGALRFSAGEAQSYRQQIAWWADYFSKPIGNGGLPAHFIEPGKELDNLTAFFAWTAWAAVTHRPGKTHSYTNNFPYDPLAGNLPTGSALLWSAISLIALLSGIALVLLAFGKFDYLGWKTGGAQPSTGLVPGNPTPGQRAVIKFFVVVAGLFLAQTLVGGATAHYRAEPESFYGLDISPLLPSNILRTWHLQLAIFWIATAYVAGALLLAVDLGGREPKNQAKLIDGLFVGLVVVAIGSLLGEWLGTFQWLPGLGFWFGQQGWEYLELGRAWQFGLAVALVFWFGLLVRSLAPALRNTELRELAGFFLIAALAIPVFYLPAMFFDGTTHFSIVDTWRFWIIHLWVEGFFELFVTVLVAVILSGLGVVSRLTAIRVIYLDAILYFGGGLIGTGHHWYFNGHTDLNMALSAIFSAMEVVPLTLLTLDAWDFVKVTRSQRDPTGKPVVIPHQWTFYFLMAVGFWNFVGAGVFGFLINLPIVSYFEVGTLLTVNHGHAAMMGVFGMLAIALLVFAVRHVSTDPQWQRLQPYFKVSFWGLNIGLLMMVVFSLFPGGVLQLMDVLDNGYWHARSLPYTGQATARSIEWLRTPGDLVFIFVGVVPAVIAVTLSYLDIRQGSDRSAVLSSSQERTEP